ncbi:MAG: hypothetical protein GX657_15125 [Chloroflexi bacterium]|nr:hypothetical protein [Chloroflexota bacterium]
MRWQDRSGVEMSSFVDPQTGREIWRLTNSSTMADRHTYYDIDPWSPDGRWIAFSSAVDSEVTTPVRDLLSTERGAVYLMDAETYAIEWLAGDAFYQTHTGAFAVWHPQGRSLFYTHSSGRIASVDIATKEVRLIEGSMRQISPDGSTIVYTVNDGPLAGRGVYTMGADGSGLRQIVSTEEVYALTPNRDLFPVDDVTVGNTKWTPDSGEMLLTIWVGLNKKPGQFHIPGVERSLYIAGRNGESLRWLTYFGHHHSWTPSASSVLFCDWLDPLERQKPRLFLVDADGSNRRVVIDEPLGGHPIMSPDGSQIATWDDDGVIVVHVAEQRSEYVATFAGGFDMSHHGTHPHPVWKADGSALLYNTAQVGPSQLCLLPMPR